MMTNERPNILVIMADHHRGDTLGSAGHPVVQTPNLDQLAAEGVRFDRAYCQGPVCTPARTSFVTERYVRDHGVDDNDRHVPPETPTFLQELQRAGYYTACAGKTHLYAYSFEKPDTRLMADHMRGLGFDESIELPAQMTTPFMDSEYTDFLKERGLYELYCDFIDERTPNPRGPALTRKGAPRYPIWHTSVSPLPLDAYIDVWTGQRAVRWLEEYDRAEPFFLWVGFPGPHNPWDAPAEYVDRYRDVEIPLGTLTLPQVPASGPLHDFLARRVEGTAAMTDEDIREVRRFFYANITLIDDQVGKIIAALERRGLLENTWILYTSDHGEMLGDHRVLAKVVFYEGAVRVPLILRPPAGQWAVGNRQSGRVVRDLVQHIDAAATIRAIAGAGEVPGSEGQSLLGDLTPRPPSLAGKGEPGPTVTAEESRLIASGDELSPHAWRGSPFPAREGGRGVRSAAISENFGMGMVVTERYKLVVHEESGLPVQLFDLGQDPNEDRNVVEDPAYARTRADLMAEHVAPLLQRPFLRPPPLETRVQVAMGWVPTAT